MESTWRRPASGYALLALAVAVLALATWKSPALVYDIGTAGDDLYVRQFYIPEHGSGGTYRWSKGLSYIKLVHAHRMGEDLEVALQVAGWPEGLGSPRVQVLAEGRLLMDFVAPSATSEHWATLHTGDYPDHNLDMGEIILQVRSDTFTPTANPRTLGVALDAVLVRRLPQWWLLGVELIGGAGLWLLLRWRTRDAAGAVRWVALLLLTLVAMGWLYQPQWLSYPLYLGCVAAAGLLALPLLLRRPLVGAALWAILLLFLLLPRLLGTWVMDDAYISFRYAQNLVQGHGLVYDPGEVVEGYTNFLWTMLAALALALGGHLPALSGLVNTLLGLGTLVLVFHIGRWAVGRSSAWPLVPVLVLALNGGFAAYTVTNSGMETALFTFLVTLAIWLYARAGPRGRGLLLAGPVLALATLTRPEGLLVVGVTFLHAAVLAWRERRPWHTLLGPALLFLSIFLPYFAWRFSYYGYLLPNTFYAKTGGGIHQVWRGLVYAWDYLLFRGLPMILVSLVGAVLAGWAWLRRRSGGRTEPVPAGSVALPPYLALLAACYAVYVVWVGGDHFPGFRFFVPIMPALALLFLPMVRAIAQWLEASWRKRAALSYVLAAIVLLSQVVPAVHLLPLGELWDGIADGMSYVVLKGYSGLWLRENTPPDTVLVATGAGAIAYFAERRTIDAWGLNDLHIGHQEMPTMGQGSAGHEKKDIDYVLAQQPDYILCIWSYYFEDDPRLKYEYHVRKVLGADGGEICWYERNDRR